MSNGYNAKNYFAHGGNELVIGGKLTFLPGAEVEGADTLPAAFADEEIAQIPNQKESEATTVAALREDFNELLSKLKAAGLKPVSNDWFFVISGNLYSYYDYDHYYYENITYTPISEALFNAYQENLTTAQQSFENDI